MAHAWCGVTRHPYDSGDHEEAQALPPICFAESWGFCDRPGGQPGRADQDCGFPTCRRAAASCDMDHAIPYHLGGLTCDCNIGPRCRRHHRVKGLGTWRLEMPQPGELRWTTPAGLTYATSPQPLVV